MKRNYDELDTAIMATIHRGVTTFTAIAHAVEEWANPHTKGSKSPYGTPPWRIVARRLQALRQKGLLVFEKKEWRHAS